MPSLPIQKTHPTGYLLSTSNLESMPFMVATFLATCPYSISTTIWRFCLLWWRYSYLTWSFMAESYFFQYLNTKTSIQSNRVSRMQRVDLVVFLFSFLLLFSVQFSYFSIFRTRVRVRVTRSRCYIAGYIRWYGHRSYDTWKNVKHSGRDDVIQYIIYMLILRYTYGHLG